MPTVLSRLFGLHDSYRVTGLLWNDDNDKSVHIIEISADGTRPIVIAYKPPDNSYAINWLTDVDGTLHRTVFAQGRAVRAVPNDKYAAQFAAEKSYWDSITAANFPPKSQ
jgi:hypothetical protein